MASADSISGSRPQSQDFTALARLKTTRQFQEYLEAGGIQLGFDPELLSPESSPLAVPLEIPEFVIGNRFCVHPMEGWDGTLEGRPSELTFKRWKRFGASGAKLIWGGEAAAVLPEARGNPHQLLVNKNNLSQLTHLREALEQAHAERWLNTSDLVIGLQLADSGRFSQPAARIVYHHPLLDAKFGLAPDYPLLTDSQIRKIIQAYGDAAAIAQEAGFDFVDLKCCHGYLGHEFLTAHDRCGPYGGSFDNRTRFLRELIAEVQLKAPGLPIGVRISAFDMIPFRPGTGGRGQPAPWQDVYPYAFGGDGSGTGMDLSETHQLLDLLESLGIRLVNISAGSPYYCPHIQRPARFPPSDGYLPPEDPLAGAARLIGAAAELKAAHPDLILVGTGYTYLQEWFPYAAQHAVRTGKIDLVGLGRLALSYPDVIADFLEGRPLQREKICRTFSDCTTAPRLGLISGCYPLDPAYRELPEAEQLKEGKER